MKSYQWRCSATPRKPRPRGTSGWRVRGQALGGMWRVVVREGGAWWFGRRRGYATRGVRRARDGAAGRTVHVGFGTNEAGCDRLECVREASGRMGAFADVVAQSGLYESAPMYRTDQPRFLNGVVSLVVPAEMPSLALLRKLKEVEAAMGRPLERRTMAGAGAQNGPRVMDLDILVEEPAVGADPGVGNYVRWQRVADEANLTGRGLLEVPHPLVYERPFALAPLMDVAPDVLVDRAGFLAAQAERDAAEGRVGGPPAAALRPLAVWEMYKACMASVLADPSSAAGAWGGGWEAEDARGFRALHAAGLARVVPVPTLREGGRRVDALWPMGWRTYVMGVLNVTPDSFSDGGRYYGGGSVEAAVAQARRMVAAGADVIDVGGQSTRPGADPVDPVDELRRVLPVMRALADALPELNAARDRAHLAEVPAAYLGHDGGQGPPPSTGVAISLDTFHGSVVEAVAGVCPVLVNDVSNGRDPGLLAACAAHRLPLILNHARGTPKTMGGMTAYPESDAGDGGDASRPSPHPLLRRARGLLGGVASELGDAADRAMLAGVEGWGIVVDPGLGFAKTHPQCAQLVRELPRLRRDRHWPVLVGASRKGFLATLTGRHGARTPEDAVARDPAGLAALTAAVAGGAAVGRVHDVGPAVDAARVADGIFRSHGFLE